MITYLASALRTGVAVATASSWTLLVASQAAAMPSDGVMQFPELVHPRSIAPDGMRCVLTYRVHGVRRGDVLFVRHAPRVPTFGEKDNQKYGIPPGTGGIEDLGPAQGGWRIVRYLGMEGYANGRFLSADVVVCAPADGASLGGNRASLLS